MTPGSLPKPPPPQPAAPSRPAAAAPAPAANPKRTDSHDSWITSFGNRLQHDVSSMLASPAMQSVERGAHNALAGAETAAYDMKSGVTKVGGHLMRKDVSTSLAHDDKARARIAAGADTNSFAFKAGKVATHVVVDTAATVALAAGGEVVLGAVGVGAAATGVAATLGVGEVAAGVAGRLVAGAAANAVGSGLVTGAEGGSVKEVLKSAAVGGLSVGMGHAVGEAVMPFAKSVAGRVAQAAPKLSGVSGKLVQVGSEVVSGAATGAGVSALTGDKPRDIAQNALFGGALSGVSAAVHLRGPAPHEGAPGHLPDPGTGAPHQPGQEHVTGSDSATDHPGALAEEVSVQERANPWLQGLRDLGPDEVKAMANNQRNLTPKLRKELGPEPPIATLLNADKNKEIITGPNIRTTSALPDRFHDAHAHEGPHSGTYDTQYKDADLERLIQLSKNGKRMTLNFPVAPHIFDLGAARPEGLPNEPAYYLQRRQGERGPENVMGVARVEGDDVHVEGLGVSDTSGEPKIKPAKYSKSDFEQLIGRKIPPGVEEMHFVASPAHTTQSYQGPRVDNSHIEMIAQHAAQLQQFAGEYPEKMKGLFIGLAGSNPHDPKSYKGAYTSLDYANKAEAKYGLPPGGLKISGFGELTVAKETVGALSKMPELNSDTVRNISQATSSMRYAGGTTVIHMDASNSIVTPDLLHPGSPSVNTFATQGQAENLGALKQLLKENPDQEIIWAHVGAAVTQTVPKGYTDQVRQMLADHPNLKIDTSWTATADMIAGHALGDKGKPIDTENVKKWAEVIVDNPDRFMWGSDTIAASQKGNVDVTQAVYKRFEDIGLLKEIKRIGSEKGSDDAIEKFLTANFESSIGKAADRVSTFRTDPENAKWLAAGGPSDANGRVPPMQWVKEGTDWTFVKSAEQPHGGNRETYEMPDGVEPSEGPAMLWLPDGKGGYKSSAGPGRETGEFPVNPNRPR